MTGNVKHIVVIESLGDERKTGDELYTDCVKRYIDYHQSKIQHSFHQLVTKKDFEETLLKYQRAIKDYQGGLLLHIEMHGDDNLKGLVMEDGSLISWSELVDAVRPLNVETCNNLYVSLATCNGRYLYKGVDIEKKSPYAAFISASQKVLPADIVSEYLHLFEKTIEKGNIIEAYKNIPEKQQDKFYYKDSETTFEEAFKVTADSFRNDPKIKQNIIDEAIAECKKQGYPPPPKESYHLIVELSLNHTYNRLKKTFNFPSC